jgi:signal transduction histidine kinase
MTSETVQDTSAMFSLMRVVKEAVNNAAKHSHARRVQIRFRFRSGVVGIRVQDDGVGMAMDQLGAKGRGINHMRERVRELGGRQQIRGHGGTCVRIVVPLPLDIRPIAPEGNLAGMGTGGGGVI